MLVTTTKGDMDDSLLVKRDGTVDNDNETPHGLSTGWMKNLYTDPRMFD
jgi:hypothetical protein